MTQKPDAILVGLGINGLGVARALDQKGIKVIALVQKSDDPTLSTKAAQTEVYDTITGPILIKHLIDIGKRYGPENKPILYLTTEDGVMQVAKHQDKLRAYFHFAMPSNDIMVRLQDKNGIADFATQAVVPQPKTRAVNTLADLDALAEFKLPIIIKPSFRDPEYDHHFQKAYKFENIDELTQKAAEILPIHNPLVAQEFIPGADDAIYFCLLVMDENQEVKAGYSGQKTSVWPPIVGGTAACIPAAKYHSELLKLSTQLLKTAKYCGMAGVEFKQDNRDGTFYLIEPTVGRTDYQAELASLNNINLPYAYYQMFLENALDEIQHVTPMDHYGWKDTMAAYSGADISQQHANVKMVSSLFRWADPMPQMRFAANRILNKLRNLLKLS